MATPQLRPVIGSLFFFSIDSSINPAVSKVLLTRYNYVVQQRIWQATGIIPDDYHKANSAYCRAEQELYDSGYPVHVCGEPMTLDIYGIRPCFYCNPCTMFPIEHGVATVTESIQGIQIKDH
jgi:hypothetical protein